MSTLDHITLTVSDYTRAKAFYAKALAPLGIEIVMEFGQACGFGRKGKPDWPLTVLVNPRVEARTDETFWNYEGCLSVPNLRGQVARFTVVRVRAWDRTGHDVDFEVKGLTAGTFQHELDHLDGKLFVDRVADTRTLCTWAEYDRFHRDEFVARARALVARFGS